MARTAIYQTAMLCITRLSNESCAPAHFSPAHFLLELIGEMSGFSRVEPIYKVNKLSHFNDILIFKLLIFKRFLKKFIVFKQKSTNFLF
jgi:hypothetical protein